MFMASTYPLQVVAAAQWPEKDDKQAPERRRLGQGAAATELGAPAHAAQLQQSGTGRANVPSAWDRRQRTANRVQRCESEKPGRSGGPKKFQPGS